ncbi:FprA family A-type flavoprotein [Thiospirochaeta perfilievii]|uniref:FprA family A-type flavoprotein n=1 Tax=Thiospirochaeta perfilievii TaxID=252967 RepID=A0A5C1QI19_9SPIO|nr:FprA family A-type flavoprotein [Thiospirochaeta perfilievii]QEN06184.1 FprA family A-type flavoprotein [Thiospirochaeta perfilievii]
MKSNKIADGIFQLGANINNGDLFEGLWPIPDGVSLNSYIVKGEKTALIDLVDDWDNAPNNLLNQLDQIDIELESIDYIVLNHLEPDHTGWIKGFLEKTKDVVIVTSPKGEKMLRALFSYQGEVLVVNDGDELDLGGQKLTFYHIPFVHWPETMVTFHKESGVLFSCDAFGSYGALGNEVFDDQISEEKHKFYDNESLRYYANIVAGYSLPVIKAIDKLEGLDVKVIAPSHGIIWRENPSIIIERYRKFAKYMSGEAEKEITMIVGSMYGKTKAVVSSIVKGIRSEGIPVHIFNVPEDDISFILSSAWKSKGLVIGMPTYEGKMFPPTSSVLEMFSLKHVWNKEVFRFGSYSWSGGAQRDFENKTEKLKWNCIEPLEWLGEAKEEELNSAYLQGKKLAIKVKES